MSDSEAGPISQVMRTFRRDPEDWLRRYSPKEWIRAAMKELRQAEAAYKQRNGQAGLTGCKRAAGMALNAALIVEPNASWKRTYIEHLEALADDRTVPGAVSEAARTLIHAPPPHGDLVFLRRPATDERMLEAARDVIAHAYAVVTRNETSSS